MAKSERNRRALLDILLAGAQKRCNLQNTSVMQAVLGLDITVEL